MACVTLHIFVKYRSQAKNMHNISKIYITTTACISLTAASSTDHKSDSGGFSNSQRQNVFQSLVLNDGSRKLGFGRVGIDEKKEFFLTEGYS